MAAAGPRWTNGDQLTGPSAFIGSKWAQPKDGATEKKFFGLSFNAYG